MQPLNHFFSYISSPIGSLTVVIYEKKLVRIYFGKKRIKQLQSEFKDATFEKSDSKTRFATAAIDRYFSGKDKHLNVPCALEGTLFQKQVWNALKKIPFGQTRSYKEIAHSIGSPKAVRAVGMANNKNPVPILIPCHRVIYKNGGLSGFMGGVSIKEKLLAHEDALMA